MLRKRILIVDDEPAILSGLSKAITKLCGFNGEIITVNNGKKAMRAINEHRIDMCFLDINLPDYNGVDLMEMIKESRPRIKFVIMTAANATSTLMKRIERTASFFIAKPIDLELLIPIINSNRKKAVVTYPAAEMNGPGKEKRRSAREQHFKTASFSLNIFYNLELKTDLEADIIDISKGGAGILTPYPIYPGNVLRFINGPESVSGIVKWSSKLGTNYRAGIKYI